jgi:Fe2+ or Zn2+ uptake regulation protein
VRERQTKQKSIIYDALTELDHPTATEVYGYVHERLPSVSRATVFRVLGGFADSGKALELNLAGSDTRYDHNVEPHYHVRCRCCGRVADVMMNADFPVRQAVTDSCGFSIDGFQIEFFGVCPDCRKKFDGDARSNIHIS